MSEPSRSILRRLWPRKRPDTSDPQQTAAQAAERAVAARRQRHADAVLDRHIEMTQRAALGCLSCDLGEPHACERAFWQQRLAHEQGRTCADLDCLCQEAARRDARAAELRALTRPRPQQARR